MKREICVEYNDEELIDYSSQVDIDICEEGNTSNFNIRVKQAGYYRFSFKFYFDKNYEKIFIPAVLYRGNSEGEGCFPRLKSVSSWHFLESRTTEPGLIIFITEDGYTLSRINKANNDNELTSFGFDLNSIEYTLPGVEKPYSYQGKRSLVEYEANPLYLTQGSVIKKSIYFEFGRETDELEIYEKHVRGLKIEQKRMEISWESYFDSKLTRVLNLIKRSSTNEAYLKMGEDNGRFQDIYEFTSASFLVKSLEAAEALAKIDESRICKSEYLENALIRIKKLFDLDEKKILKQLSIKIGEYFLSAESSSGIFQDCENLKTHERGGYLGVGEHPEFKNMINSRTNGEAMTSYVKLYELTKDNRFLEIAKRVASFYLKNQLESGSYGRWFTKSGDAVVSNGTNGAYIGLFFITLLPHLDSDEKEKTLQSLKKALKYYSKLALSGEFFADTLDADSADKEAGVSLLSLMLSAAEYFKSDEYILPCKRAASFIISWMHHEECFLSENSILRRYNFSSLGMTAVSIAHHHLDFYGMLIANDFLRLHRLTGDDFYKREAYLMMNACRQLICLKPGELSRDIYGFQPEQINHTLWDYFSAKEQMNGTFNIDISWPHVLGLNAYLKIQEEFPLALCDN